MALLLLGLLVFLGVHSVRIVAPAPREAAIARWGEGAWKLLYSVVAAVGLVLVVIGYGAAREAPIVLFDPPTATRHLALLLMLPVFPLLLAAYLPGRIKTTLKHPMLVAVKLWALAHLLANGTLADLVLFGGFLAWAVVDRISIKRHPRQASVGAPGGPLNDGIAVLGGLALYGLFVLWAHEALFGVAPLA
ncbi:NnrU family protein [Chthonobacter rhizosphaerae]|uniref:NnrU family protein n=1 Tax=Chthonobacter rhizosphaerae TaxID=2735553 RepID=UPI0015EF603E|nr:NnrU family protein [Chthonobacter rhizosphaerae]